MWVSGRGGLSGVPPGRPAVLLVHTRSAGRNGYVSPSLSLPVVTVLLVRHGETTWNRDGRVQGWAASTLTDRGHEQAQALAAHLADVGIDRLIASDLRRAVETARYVARATGVEPEPDSAWRERDFGRFQGLGYRDLFEGHPQFAVSETGYRSVTEPIPDGEALIDVRERVLDAWRGLCAEMAGPDDSTDSEDSGTPTVAVVTHGTPLYVLLGYLAGEDIATTLTERGQDNCAVNEVFLGADGPTIRRENDTSFL